MSTPTETTPATEAPHKGIGLMGLIALVISSSIGSGVFALSTDISAAAAPGAAIVAWILTGVGFIALGTTFGRLSLARPDLRGIVAYAEEGFGRFVGFVSGWGYWLATWIGNVAFAVMLCTAIGYFYPPLRRRAHRARGHLHVRCQLVHHPAREPWCRGSLGG